MFSDNTHQLIISNSVLRKRQNWFNKVFTHGDTTTPVSCSLINLAPLYVAITIDISNLTKNYDNEILSYFFNE